MELAASFSYVLYCTHTVFPVKVLLLLKALCIGR